MNSIQRRPFKDNHEDLQGDEAVKKLQELSGKAESCFFCTRITTGERFSARPMAVLQVDDEGNCWFLSASDSHKNHDISADPAVQLLFQCNAYSHFMTVYGKASIHQDKEKIKELWKPQVKTWFTAGIDDPRISVIKFVPSAGYYWDTKYGQIVAFAKQVVV